MKKFKFNLENVLKQRETLQKMAQRKYFELRQKINDERVRAGEIEEQIETAQAESMAMRKEDRAIPASEFREYQYYLEHLADSLRIVFQNIECMEKDLESVQQALIHASQNKKIIVRLKEKASVNYALKANRVEEQFLDEITVMRSRVKS
jgi:flagellar export protein FliJ